MHLDIRWRQRLQNFARAVTLLREAVGRGIENLSELEREGTVQRFEVALELGWKTLKDYLEHAGAVLTPVTPRAVVKAAYAARIVANGQTWIDMLDHRNLLSQTYDQAAFTEAVEAVRDRYLPELERLRDWLEQRPAE